eukprot:gene7898-8713_t
MPDAATASPATVEPPLDLPFFPRSMDELAEDISYCVKLGLIRREGRMRVDVKHASLYSAAATMRWLLLLLRDLQDEDLSQIHLFVDEQYKHTDILNIWRHLPSSGHHHPIGQSDGDGDGLQRWGQEKSTKMTSKRRDNTRKLKISPFNREAGIHRNDKLVVVFEPSNIFLSYREKGAMLEDLQVLCFQAAMKEIPVVLINPHLLSVRMAEMGSTEPFLLSDFSTIYRLDDRVRRVDGSSWLGTVSRMLPRGADAYLLSSSNIRLSSTNGEGLVYKTAQRVKAFGDGVPEDLTSVAARLLMQQPGWQEHLAVASSSSR